MSDLESLLEQASQVTFEDEKEDLSGLLDRAGKVEVEPPLKYKEKTPVFGPFTGPPMEYERIDDRPRSLEAAIIHAAAAGENPEKYVTSRLPVAGGVIEAADTADMLLAAKRIESGEASPRDFKLVGDYLVQGEREGEKSWGRRVTDVVSALPGFAMEFGLTGGAYSVGRKGAEKVAGKVLGKAAESAAGKVAAAVGSRAAGVALQTAANPQLIARETADQLTKNLSLSKDASGGLQVALDLDTPGFLEALGKGAASAAIELGSERAGRALIGGAKGIGKAAVGLVPESVGSAISRTAGAATAKAWESLPEVAKVIAIKAAAIKQYLTKPGSSMEQLQAILKKGGWNGVFGEILEERVAEPARGVLGIQDYGVTGDVASGNWGKALDRLSVEAAAFAIPGAATMTVQGTDKLGGAALRKVGDYFDARTARKDQKRIEDFEKQGEANVQTENQTQAQADQGEVLRPGSPEGEVPRPITDTVSAPPEAPDTSEETPPPPAQPETPAAEPEQPKTPDRNDAFSGLPPWVAESMRSLADEAEQSGLAEKIASAQGESAKVADELGTDEFTVRAVRTARGIPEQQEPAQQVVPDEASAPSPSDKVVEAPVRKRRMDDKQIREEAPQETLPPEEMPKAPSPALPEEKIEEPVAEEPKPVEPPTPSPIPGEPAETTSRATDMDSFLVDKPKMVQGRLKKTLSATVQRNGKEITTRQAMIEDAVQNGAVVETKEAVDSAAAKKMQARFDKLKHTAPIGNENHPETIELNQLRETLKQGGPKVMARRLVWPDGRFMTESDTTKAAMDYAEHLLKAKGSPSTEAPAQEPVEPSSQPRAEFSPPANAETAVQIAQTLDPQSMGQLLGAFQRAHQAGYVGRQAQVAASQMYYATHDGPVPDAISNLKKFTKETVALEEAMRPESLQEPPNPKKSRARKKKGAETVTEPPAAQATDTVSAPTLSEKAKAAREEFVQSAKEFADIAKTSAGSGLSNPALVKQAAVMTKNAIKAGVLTFADFMQGIALAIGEKAAQQYRAIFEEEWNKQKSPEESPKTSEEAPQEPEQTPSKKTGEIPVTSIKNAIVNDIRARRKVPELLDVPAETQQEWLDEAERQINADPTIIAQLINELNTTPRTIEDVETAILQIEYRRLNNGWKAASDKLFAAYEAKDPAAQASAQAGVDAIFQELARFESATKAAGREWGRAGVARQIQLLVDYTLDGLTRRARVAKGGAPLTEAENLAIKKMADRIQELESQLQKLLETRDQEASEKRIDTEIKKVVEEQKKPKKRSWKEKAQEKADKAWSAFKEKFSALGKMGAVYEPGKAAQEQAELLSAAVEVVKAYTELGVASFAELMAHATKKMGQQAAQYRDALKEAWEQVKSEGGIQLHEVDPTNLESLSRLAQKLTRAVVEAGTTDREAVIDAVHEELKEIVSDITRRQTMDAMAGYGIFKELSKDEISVKVRDLSGQIRQLAKLDDLKQKKAPKKSGIEYPEPSDEERQLERQVREGMKAAEKEGWLKTNSERNLKSALASRKTALRNRMADLKWEIDHKERIVKNKSDLTEDAEYKRMRAEYEELKRLHEEVFPKPEMTQAQKEAAAEKALDRSIANLEADLKSGSIGRKIKAAILSNPSIDAKRARLEALRALREELRESDPQYQADVEGRKLAAYKRNLLNRLADYQDRIAKKDFAKKSISKVVLDKKARDLMYEMEEEKLRFQKLEEAWQRKTRPVPMRVLGLIPEAINTSRAIMTSFDFSAVLRQGLFVTVSHPVLAAKALPAMFKAFVSKKQEFTAMEELRSRANADLYAQAGLSITTSTGRLSKQEEAYMGRLSRYLPGVAASERAYLTFLNRIRADVFDTLVHSLGKRSAVTLAEAQVIANYVNVATGRGSMGKSFEPAMAAMATVFFSPRYMASRFQMLALQPMWRGNLRTKALIAKEYAKVLMGLGTVYGLAALYGMINGDDEDDPVIELDPRSADFLKIKIGRIRLDPLAGLSQTTVLLSRLITGEQKKQSGKVVPIRTKRLDSGRVVKVPYGSDDAWDVIGKYVRGKMSPGLGTGIDILVGEDFKGDLVTPAKALERTVKPLSLADASVVDMTLGDIHAAMQEQGVPVGVSLGLLSIFGMSLQHYEPRKR
jgi:hypothetical protein